MAGRCNTAQYPETVPWALEVRLTMGDASRALTKLGEGLTLTDSDRRGLAAAAAILKFEGHDPSDNIVGLGRIAANNGRLLNMGHAVLSSMADGKEHSSVEAEEMLNTTADTLGAVAGQAAVKAEALSTTYKTVQAIRLWAAHERANRHKQQPEFNCLGFGVPE